MSKIKNGGLHQYGAEPFEQQQLGTAGVEGVNEYLLISQYIGRPYIWAALQIQDRLPKSRLVASLNQCYFSCGFSVTVSVIVNVY